MLRDIETLTKVILFVSKWALVLFVGWFGARNIVFMWAGGDDTLSLLSAISREPIAGWAVLLVSWFFISAFGWLLLRIAQRMAQPKSR